MYKIRQEDGVVIVFGEYFRLGRQKRPCNCGGGKVVEVIPRRENSKNRSPEMGNKLGILRD